MGYQQTNEYYNDNKYPDYSAHSITNSAKLISSISYMLTANKLWHT